MPAQDSQGRYITPAETLGGGAAVASAARTATANGTAFDTSGYDSITGVLTVTAASGTNVVHVPHLSHGRPGRVTHG